VTPPIPSSPLRAAVACQQDCVHRRTPCAHTTPPSSCAPARRAVDLGDKGIRDLCGCAPPVRRPPFPLSVPAPRAAAQRLYIKTVRMRGMRWGAGRQVRAAERRRRRGGGGWCSPRARWRRRRVAGADQPGRTTTRAPPGRRNAGRAPKKLSGGVLAGADTLALQEGRP
jgi:hypothetical protein